MFENISMAWACKKLFKACHQAPLKAKYMHVLSLGCYFITS